MKKAFAFFLFCLLLCSISASAQSLQQSPTTVIDGASNPSQIPDDVAYRLYFYVLTNENQTTNIAALHLDAADAQAAINILDNFKSDDEQLRGQHNSAAASGSINAVTFQNERNALVESTRASLKNSLSIQGMSSIDSAVQINKTNTKLTVSQSSTLVSDASASIATTPPPIIFPKCPAPTILWTVSAAQTNVYSATNTTASSNVVFDGSATYSVRWQTNCLPGYFAPPTYTPKVYNSVNNLGGWTTGTPVNAGAEFSIGSTVNFSFNTTQVLVFSGGLGDELDGSESSYQEYPVIIEPVINPLQFEIAYERTATTGSRSGCIRNSDGSTSCFVSQVAWCNPKGTPPDLNVVSVFTETYPISPLPFFENWAACERQSSGGTWSCSAAFSLGNPNPAPGLGFCTKTP